MKVIKDGGSIVNVGSSLGQYGAPGVAAYATAKHGLIGLTKVAAFEGAPRRVRVNALCPYENLAIFACSRADKTQRMLQHRDDDEAIQFFGRPVLHGPRQHQLYLATRASRAMGNCSIGCVFAW
jgi:NAD(P)-dependent dehydrogenase (short-subunit alcohol dehydrogenase family)